MTFLTYAGAIQIWFALYPFAKRVTNYPQIVLAVPFGGGVFLTLQSLGLDLFALDVGGFWAATSLAGAAMTWPVLFDYVSACRDTADDFKAGVKGMAVRFRNSTAFISILGSLQVGLLASTGLWAGFGKVYYMVACGGNAFLMGAMAMTAGHERSRVCTWWYTYGGLLVGGVTSVGLMGEYVQKSRKEVGDGEMQ